MAGASAGHRAAISRRSRRKGAAAEIRTVGPDFGHLEPMLDATQRKLARAGADELPEVVPADAGYWHGEEMQRIVDRGSGPHRADTSRRRTTRRNCDGSRYDEMRRVLASERGGGSTASANR